MSPYCKGCAFRQYPSGNRIYVESNCGFSLITGHLRDCLAGEGCAHKIKELPKQYRHKERCNRLLNGCTA